MTLTDFPNAISSPASVDGAEPCASPDGPTTDLFGREVAPASPSPSPASAKVIEITGTYGLSSDDSSPSAVLQRCLASRLRERLTGSVSCEVIWKRWRTPWGPTLSRPRARARTISGIDIGLWPTMVAQPDNKSPQAHLEMKRRMGERDGTGANRTAITDVQVMVKAVSVAVWPTMTANSPAKDYNEAGNSAGQVAIRKIALGLWPTATASDHKSRSASQETLERNARPLREVIFALWSTIRASDGEKGGPNQSFGAGGSPLPSQVSGIGNTSNAPTENGAGSLHPEFAGWEMEYPPAWLNCAPSATPSTRARRRSS